MNIFLIMFLALPPAMFIAKSYWRWRISTVLLFIGYLVLGWILINLAVWWHFEMLSEKLQDLTAPSEKLMETIQNDGAKRVFALYFGWAYALIYFVFWLLARLVVTRIKTIITRTHNVAR